MNDDYVILIDENGQPYIAHGVIGNALNAAKSTAGRAWNNHKYIAKQIVGNYTRYFYTPEEIKAFYRSKKAPTEKEKDWASQQWAKAKYRVQSNRNAAKETIKKNATETLDNVRKNAGEKARAAVKWADEHDAGLTETMRYARNRKTADQATKNRLHEEMTSTKIGKMASKVGSTPQSLQKAKESLSKKATAAAKWADEHDAGLTETLRYARNRKTADQETKDRLHDEMTSTTIGKMASKVGSLPQTVPSAGSKAVKQAKELLAKADPNISISGNTITGYGRSVTIPEELMNNAYAIYGWGMGLFNKKDKE